MEIYVSYMCSSFVTVPHSGGRKYYRWAFNTTATSLLAAARLGCFFFQLIWTTKIYIFIYDSTRITFDLEDVPHLGILISGSDFLEGKKNPLSLNFFFRNGFFLETEVSCQRPSTLIPVLWCRSLWELPLYTLSLTEGSQHQGFSAL